MFEEKKLYLLPVQGSDTQWYKNLLRHREIGVSTRGVEAEFHTDPVTDPESVASIVEKFRVKYGAKDVKKYYSKFDVAVVVELTWNAGYWCTAPVPNAAER